MKKSTDSLSENTSEPSKTSLPDIPEWHKAILDERLKEFEKNPNLGTSIKEFKKELIADGLI